MTMQRDCMRWKNLLVGLVSWAGLVGVAACSSSEEAPGGGRVAHPVTVNPGTSGLPGTAAPPPSTYNAPRPSSQWVTPPPVASRPLLSNSEYYELRRGLKPSPEDKAILDDCPERAWSKNVPNRACTFDNECGDGFCDVRPMLDATAPLRHKRAPGARTIGMIDALSFMNPKEPATFAYNMPEGFLAARAQLIREDPAIPLGQRRHRTFSFAFSR